ncbi:DUF2550 domain-containing protein [uncultured Corynebacterium sp.]|uniref:DUF2550 domain-containing protein n=1 Tax=uncultured Corynebacterium sp. TaxID=159447 RepID=UPI0026267EE6|nr:DUF2550 domain-containing protein [uncultured Corynebacterium sp.]
MKLLGFLVGAVVVVLLAGAVWRFLTVRNNGTPALLRELPAVGTQGWRHGIAAYSGDILRFFKLRSFSFSADTVFDRCGVEITGRRKAIETERDFMPGVSVVVSFVSHGEEYEFALDTHAAMAFTSWVESAPDIRQERTDVNRLYNRAFRGNQ